MPKSILWIIFNGKFGREREKERKRNRKEVGDRKIETETD